MILVMAVELKISKVEVNGSIPYPNTIFSVYFDVPNGPWVANRSVKQAMLTRLNQKHKNWKYSLPPEVIGQELTP